MATRTRILVASTALSSGLDLRINGQLRHKLKEGVEYLLDADELEAAEHSSVTFHILADEVVDAGAADDAADETPPPAPPVPTEGGGGADQGNAPPTDTTTVQLDDEARRALLSLNFIKLQAALKGLPNGELEALKAMEQGEGGKNRKGVVAAIERALEQA